jgi:hypothetical protein
MRLRELNSEPQNIDRIPYFDIHYPIFSFLSLHEIPQGQSLFFDQTGRFASQRRS